MHRHASKASLAGSTASSRITKIDHTHVIIQNPSDNKGLVKYIVLPVKNLINFGRPLKTNDLVTYKIDLKGRGTNRGKIVLFGSEDDCTEQVQILSAVADENDVEISGTGETFDTSDLQPLEHTSCDRVCNKKETNKENVGNRQSSVQLVKKNIKRTEKGLHERQSTSEKNLNINKPSKNQITRKIQNSKVLNNKLSNKSTANSKSKITAGANEKTSEQTFVQKSIADRTDGSQKTLDQMLKKVVVGTSSVSKSSITYETSTKPSSKINCNTNIAKNSRTAQRMSAPLQTLSLNTNEKQQLSVGENGCSVEDDDDDDIDEDQNNKHQIQIDPAIDDKDYFLKLYNNLYRDHQTLQNKHKQLALAYRHLKQNSLPMPSGSGRQWLIDVGNLLAPKLSQSNTDSIATALGIKKSSMLNSCIRNTPTNTTRQVVKLLYTPDQLKKGRGSNVTPVIRKLIKEFVVQEHGSVESRPFREAINGVFRNHAHNNKKKMDTLKSNNVSSINNQENEPTIGDDINEENLHYFENDEEEEDEEDDDDNELQF